MRFLILCPTFGRPTLLANAVACYLAQDYPAELRHLRILDDAGQYSGQSGDGWILHSTRDRYETITEKYAALSLAIGGYDAIALLDDDDPVGPSWLSSHARALENAQWSYPHEVLTLHRPPSKGFGQPGREASGGRFWASAAVRVDLLRRMGGFIQTPAADFDLQHLAKWQEFGGDPGRPDDFAGPQYCYGWGRAKHVSVHMSHADWYERHGARGLMEPGRVEKLVPKMDEETRMIYRDTWGVNA